MEQKIINYTDEVEKDFKEYIFETSFAPNIKISPLKSYEVASAEARQQINDYVEVYKKSLDTAMQLFITMAETPEEKKAVALFINEGKTILDIKAGVQEDETVIPIKTTGEMSENFDCLENLAKKQLIEKKYENSSCMFNLLAQVFPFFSSAWVGWAISEQELGKIDVAAAIYDSALLLLPNNSYLILFVANFYLQNNQSEKAKSLVHSALQHLELEGQKASTSYKELEKIA